MIRSALKTSASHGSDCSSVRLMGCATNEHIAQLDLRENPSTPSGLVTLIPRLGQGFECPVRRAQALRYIAVTLRPSHNREKLLSQHTEQGQVLDGQRLCMLYELRPRYPQP
jgi:hypothetical protein